MMKKFIRFALTFAIIVLILIGSGVCVLYGKYVVPIMMYHNVEPSDVVDAGNVSPERFRQHMEFIRKNGYKVIPLEELVEIITQGRKLPKKTVVLTFDDGYENNFQYAFPILKEYNYPATIFLCPGLMGQFLEGEKILTWEQVKTMREQGITFASHSLTHAYLPDLSTEEQIKEIEESKRILEEKLDEKIKYFAFPIGGFTQDVQQMVRDAGYSAAFTTNRGYDRLEKDVFELNRIRLSDKNKEGFDLWAKLTGYYNLFRKLKNPS